MKVLDIDLDFFLSEVAYFSDDNSRLDESDGFIPWTEVKVRKFLEQNCGLNKDKPIKGAYCIHHHEVFILWRSLIFEGRLETPFEVVHVDAHADLGLGDASWQYIMGELLHEPVDKRVFPKEGGWDGLGSGNYLAFALACRWIKRLSYIRHPKSDDDILHYYYKDFDEESGYLQLPKYDMDKLQNNPDFHKANDPISLEPPVPFDIVVSSKYQSKSNFSYVFLTQSPSYTPQSSDKLIHLIMEYIKEIKTG